ncbi:hypothetical protein DFQ26_000651, partial [Actinomortierella ambigua]
MALACMHDALDPLPARKMSQSPVDISELRILIGSFLAVQDVKACTLVCKSWYPDFHPLIWRTLQVTISALNHIDAWRDCLEKYGHWIMHIEGRHNMDLLASTLDILLVCCRSLQSFEVEVRHPAEVMIWWHPLVRRNRWLRQLKFSPYTLQPWKRMSLPVWHTLMELNHLYRLEMVWTCSVPFLRQVLVSCPSLRDLIVSALCLGVGEDEEEEEGDEDDSDDNEFQEEYYVFDPSDDDSLDDDDEDDEDNEECQVDMEEMKTKVFALRRFQVSTGTNYIPVSFSTLLRGLLKQMPGLERLALAAMPLGRTRELRMLVE